MTHTASLAGPLTTGSPTEALWRPRDTASTTTLLPVVVMHGANGFPVDYRKPINPGAVRLASALADAGLTCLATEMGGPQTWGSDSVLTAFDHACARLEELGFDTDRGVLVWATSMGNWSALRCAADRPGKVKAVVATIPLCDINDIRQRNAPIPVRPDIDAAWGVSFPAPIPRRGDLLARAGAGELAGLPWRGYYSTADTVCRPETVTALVAALGSSASAQITSTTADHSDTPISNTPTAQFVEFLRSHA